MFCGPYAPWEHYPKSLRHTEVQHPLTVIHAFFSSDCPSGHRKYLKQWRDHVITEQCYKDAKGSPAGLLYQHRLMLNLTEALYLLLLENRQAHPRPAKPNPDQLTLEKQEWDYYPKNLSAKELVDPFKAIKEAFKIMSPAGYREHLEQWLHFGLSNRAADETLSAGEVITVYEQLQKLFSAAWLLHQRSTDKKESGSIGKGAAIKNTNLKSIRSLESAVLNLKEPTVQVVLSTEQAKSGKVGFTSSPLSPGEKYAFGELSNFMVKEVPSVRMIVRVGSYSEPLIYFLLVLIDDREKLTEQELTGRIEDKCKVMAPVFLLVHKVKAAHIAIQQGRRFWNMTLPQCPVLFQSPELTLPSFTTVSESSIPERAAYHWQRWGDQGWEFLWGAKRYLEEGNYRLAAFLLHQSAESTLTGIIRAVMGYPVTLRNLFRMLKLTLLFTDELWQVFNLETEEGAKVFQLLQTAYTNARYQSSFNPDESSVRLLALKVDQLQEQAQRVYELYAEQLS